MKLEISERLFVEQLLYKSNEALKLANSKLKNLNRLTGDASTRRYYRAEFETKTYVICLDHPNETGNKNDFLLVQEFLNNATIKVPQIYDFDLTKGYILEEDLGNTTMLQELGQIKDKESELDLYKNAIDELIKLHLIPINKDHPNCLNRFFDKEKLNYEIKFSTKYFLEKFIGVKEDLSNEIFELFTPVVEHMVKGDFVFCHRDYHSRNLMLKNKNLYVIDFQDIRQGIAQYDLVSLLEDCYYDLDDKNLKELKLYYYKNCFQKLSKKSYEEFCFEYDMTALHRVFKAIGSFSFIYMDRSDYRYIKYIGFGMEKIKQIMFKYKELDELRLKLFSIYYAS